ncbi:hypothetical protein ElyMa_006121500 [Elysia marginata]|uniref:Uncharacterized protein n=1 Tax=Elysia marginata TaxID=1093978 RepID=A0AAV4GUY4_9GAST|nr:hypothetical protein ElyMa_006121500 [Elysia marginata]
MSTATRQPIIISSKSTPNAKTPSLSSTRTAPDVFTPKTSRLGTTTGRRKPTPPALPGDDTITTGYSDVPGTRQGTSSTVLPGRSQQQKGSKAGDSTPIIAGAAGGAVVLVILVGAVLLWRRKRRPSQKGRTIPVDDNLSYHSLDHGLEFDNVGYDQFINTHTDRQISAESDSRLVNADTSSNQLARHLIKFSSNKAEARSNKGCWESVTHLAR